jgi:hypothetical protein
LTEAVYLPSKETDRKARKRLPKFAIEGITNLNTSTETTKSLTNGNRNYEANTIEKITESVFSGLDSKKSDSTGSKMKKNIDVKASVERNSYPDNTTVGHNLSELSTATVRRKTNKGMYGLFESTLSENEELPEEKNCLHSYNP